MNRLSELDNEYIGEEISNGYTSGQFVSDTGIGRISWELKIVEVDEEEEQ